LSEQPIAQELAKKLTQARHGSERYWTDRLGNNPDGQKLWRELNTGGGKIEEELKNAGFPGIRYLDGGSRGTGEGSYNYVVFDDKIPRIVERNGKTLKDYLK
jgi:hypothetical protein